MEEQAPSDRQASRRAQGPAFEEQVQGQHGGAEFDDAGMTHSQGDIARDADKHDEKG